MKDHEIAQVVNQLRDIAVQFHNIQQQLRERIAGIIVPILKTQEGWKLVPIEPTKAMNNAGYSKNLELGGAKRNPEATYKAMLDAAPKISDSMCVGDSLEVLVDVGLLKKGDIGICARVPSENISGRIILKGIVEYVIFNEGDCKVVKQGPNHVSDAANLTVDESTLNFMAKTLLPPRKL